MATKKEDLSPSVEKKLVERNSSIPSQEKENRKGVRNLFCEVCQKPFTGEQSQQEHMKSEKHKRKVEMSASAPQNTKSESLDKQIIGELCCKVCQKTFTGAQSMREHEQSEKHRRKVEALKTLKTEDLNFVKQQLLKNSNPSMTVDDKQSMECRVCQKSFTGEQSRQEHLKSEKHLKKVSRA